MIENFFLQYYLSNCDEEILCNSLDIIKPKKSTGRLRIGADIYGSVQAARHEKSSYILARFVQDDDTVDTYPGQVQFFFEHTIYLNNKSITHSLALVK